MPKEEIIKTGPSSKKESYTEKELLTMEISKKRKEVTRLFPNARPRTEKDLDALLSGGELRGGIAVDWPSFFGQTRDDVNFAVEHNRPYHRPAIYPVATAAIWQFIKLNHPDRIDYAFEQDFFDKSSGTYPTLFRHQPNPEYEHCWCGKYIEIPEWHIPDKAGHYKNPVFEIQCTGVPVKENRKYGGKVRQVTVYRCGNFGTPKHGRVWMYCGHLLKRILDERSVEEIEALLKRPELGPQLKQWFKIQEPEYLPVRKAKEVK